MGARLIAAARTRRRVRALLLVSTLSLAASSCASGGTAGAPSVLATTATDGSDAPPTTIATTSTEAATTSTAATTTVPATTTTPTTPAPTTTTTLADPPEVACPERPPPLRDVSAALDAEPADAPGTGVPTRSLPRSGFAVRPGAAPAVAAASEPDPAVQAILNRMAAVPTSFSVGDWLGDGVTAAVADVTRAASAAGKVAVLQIYDLPHRDAGGGFSAGGAPTADAYRAFTAAVVAGIGSAPTIVVLEPDSLGQMRALTAAQQRERYQLLNEAVDAYAAVPTTWVYLDGTHCGWLSAELNAERLVRAGVARAQGFFVNVANYQPTDAEVARGHRIAELTGGRHFIVDTGRNGNGPYPTVIANRWCNPPGRALGDEPTFTTTSRYADAYLWVKQPGSSDGTCGRGNPPAGTFWTERAVDLARNAGW